MLCSLARHVKKNTLKRHGKASVHNKITTNSDSKARVEWTAAIFSSASCSFKWFNWTQSHNGIVLHSALKSLREREQHTMWIMLLAFTITCDSLCRQARDVKKKKFYWIISIVILIAIVTCFQARWVPVWQRHADELVAESLKQSAKISHWCRMRQINSFFVALYHPPWQRIHQRETTCEACFGLIKGKFKAEAF